MGRLVLINGLSRECTKIVVRAMSSKEADATPSSILIVETYGVPTACADPKFHSRMQGTSLQVYDLRGNGFDAEVAALATGALADVGLVLYVKVACHSPSQPPPPQHPSVLPPDLVVAHRFSRCVRSQVQQFLSVPHHTPARAERAEGAD